MWSYSDAVFTPRVFTGQQPYSDVQFLVNVRHMRSCGQSHWFLVKPLYSAEYRSTQITCLCVPFCQKQIRNHIKLNRTYSAMNKRPKVIRKDVKRFGGRTFSWRKQSAAVEESKEAWRASTFARERDAAGKRKELAFYDELVELIANISLHCYRWLVEPTVNAWEKWCMVYVVNIYVC